MSLKLQELMVYWEILMRTRETLRFVMIRVVTMTTGWDTDQFMTDISEATMVMLSVIRNGGLAPGGFNFDAKLRRESTEVEDIFLAHISGMDTLARGLRSAAKLIQDGSLAELVRKRYQSFDTEIGARVEAGKGDFETLEKLAMKWGEPKVPSAKQELAGMIFQSAL
ncbi:hypothetical protein H0E87_029447 [Populus deltoides]|uniref:xylose isomerase n=1 Tax=Populus deltoides TaxID=3696 RepID=A0A8T2WQI9_POPDE|nr:hypothetical protein H0E87_029447 [Populus deltoides]